MLPRGAPQLRARQAVDQAPRREPQERVANGSGRDAVVATLAGLVRPGLGPGTESPDPQLTARTLSAVADEAARLLLTDPQAYPIERLVAHAEWLLGRLEPPSG